MVRLLRRAFGREGFSLMLRNLVRTYVHPMPDMSPAEAQRQLRQAWGDERYARFLLERDAEEAAIAVVDRSSPAAARAAIDLLEEVARPQLRLVK